MIADHGSNPLPLLAATTWQTQEALVFAITLLLNDTKKLHQRPPLRKSPQPPMPEGERPKGNNRVIEPCCRTTSRSSSDTTPCPLRPGSTPKIGSCTQSTTSGSPCNSIPNPSPLRLLHFLSRQRSQLHRLPCVVKQLVDVALTKSRSRISAPGYNPPLTGMHMSRKHADRGQYHCCIFQPVHIDS